MITINDNLFSSFYTKRSLQSFLKELNQSYSGNKDTLIKKINKLIEKEVITDEQLLKWHVKIAMEGNRHIYIQNFNEIDYDIVNKYNEFISSNKDKLYYHNCINNEQNKKIEFLYIDEGYTQITIGKDKKTEKESDMLICVKIDYIKKEQIISFLPYSNFYINDTSISSYRTYNKISHMLKKEFSLSYCYDKIVYNKILNFLFDNYNKTVSTILKPYIDKLDVFNNEYIEACMVKIMEDKKDSPIIKSYINQKIRNVWESTLINYSKNDFNYDFEYGKITKEYLKSKNGCNVKIGSPKTAIHSYDLHQDIKALNELDMHLCNRLGFEWLFKDKSITTILECYKNYFHIIYTKDSNREEIDYVFSRIDEIKNRILCD